MNIYVGFDSNIISLMSKFSNNYYTYKIMYIKCTSNLLSDSSIRTKSGFLFTFTFILDSTCDIFRAKYFGYPENFSS